MPAIATSDARDSTTRSARILISIKDQRPGDDGIGRYAGWGSEQDVHAPAGKGERMGPSMLPRGWGRSAGLLWVPAVIVLVTVELWLGVPQVAGWISLIGLFAAIMLLNFWIDRRNR